MSSNLPARTELFTLFRERLKEVIAKSGLSKSAFAARAGIDRSTLSQILSAATDRLPRVETLTAIAMSERISLDWLVGMSQEASVGSTMMEALEITRGQASPADERLQGWYDEAMGYKIRHVPTNLPDVLKTDAVIEYEYQRSAAASPQQRFATRTESLNYQRRTETDTEICTSRQAIEEFASGHGIWNELPSETRRAQIRQWRQMTRELYPTFRWFLYDERTRYSVPMTVFGPRRAVVYVGQGYFVFNGTDHIRALTTHFDDLIRAAVVQSTEVDAYLDALIC